MNNKLLLLLGWGDCSKRVTSIYIAKWPLVTWIRSNFLLYLYLFGCMFFSLLLKPIWNLKSSYKLEHTQTQYRYAIQFWPILFHPNMYIVSFKDTLVYLQLQQGAFHPRIHLCVYTHCNWVRTYMIIWVSRTQLVEHCLYALLSGRSFIVQLSVIIQ